MDIATCEHEARSRHTCYALYIDTPSGGNSPLVQAFCNYGNKNVMVQAASAKSLGLPSLLENDKLTVGELSVCLKEMLHVHKSSNSTEASMSHDIDESSPLEGKPRKSLSKSATFPSSEGLQSSFASIQRRQGCLSELLQDPSSSEFENPAYTRSMSMPVSSKLVSAMKGGRESSGSSLSIKLYVKWAPEVYDPPATSMSHTVQDKHQRPKAKKKDQHKHRHNGKGKSSRGNGSRRSTGNRVDPSDMRLPVTNDSFILDRCHQSKMELSDYAVSTEEGKCGNNFLKESLATVQSSIVEAA